MKAISLFSGAGGLDLGCEDRIASTAMHCAALLEEIARRHGKPVDRAGADGIVEVYPAAALTVWLPGYVSGYKGSEKRHREARADLIERLAPPDGWLKLDADQRTLCIKHDDALDGLLCALIARAFAVPNQTEPPPRDPPDLEQVQREGWIHVPKPGSLARLP